MAIFFIDRFTMPVNAKEEFMERANINRAIIKALPGFIEDSFYEMHNGDSYNVVTVAVWANEAAIAHAKQVVQDAYHQQGFDMPAMLKRLGIQIDRGVYTKMAG